MAVLVFCLQNNIYSQIVSNEGVDYSSRRLSVFEQNQNRALAAYARARFLLSDEDISVEAPELKEALRLALHYGRGDEELLALLVARHLQDRTPEKLFAVLKKLAQEYDFSPRFLNGAAAALGELMRRPGLGLRLLTGETAEKYCYEFDEATTLMLFRLMSLCLERKTEVRLVEDLLAFFQAEYSEYVFSSRHRLFFADTLLQYRIYLNGSGRQLPVSWEKIKDALVKEICSSPEIYDSEDTFYVMFRVLVMEGEYGRLEDYLELPEIRKKFGAGRFWCRFSILTAAALGNFIRVDQLLDRALRENALETAELYSLARNCARRKLHGLTLKIYTHLLEKFPRAAELRIVSARLCCLLNRPWDGIKILMSISPMPVEGYVILACLWQQAGNQEKSWQCFSQADKMFLSTSKGVRPDSFFYLSAGLSAYKTGRREDAVRWLRQAHRMAPEDANICNSLGYVLADYQMELHLAEKLLAYALKHSGAENLAVMDSVAWLFFRQNRLPDAVDMMIEVLKNGSRELLKDREIRQHAYEIFRKSGLLKLAEFYRPATSEK